MPDAAIWIVVANDNNAAICVSSNGSSELLRVVVRKNRAVHAVDDGCEAFALQIMAEIFRGAQNGSYNGFVLMAGHRMMTELDRITLPEIRKLLVAQIVKTGPDTVNVPAEQPAPLLRAAGG